MGGQTGFGPVPAEDDGQFFHADWEARVYAIVRVLQRRGVINAAFDDLRDAIERIPPAEYLAAVLLRAVAAGGGDAAGRAGTAGR